MAVINAETNKVVASIPVGDEPDGIAVSPDGTRVYAYVTNVESGGDGRVAVIHTATNSVVTAISVGMGAGNVAVSPDGAVVYATNLLDGTLSVIDTTTNTVTDTITIAAGGAVWGPVISPDGTLVYVTRPFDDAVSVLAPTPQGVAPSHLADLVGRLLGGGANGGDGWLLVGDHFTGSRRPGPR